jgi:hypothetical protein
VEVGDEHEPTEATKLERNAEALRYHPRDPEKESYHAWEYGFVQHCVRVHGKYVHRHHDWYIEQGFRPVMLSTFLDVAHQPRKKKRRKEKPEREPWLSDAQKGILLVSIIVLTLIGLYIALPDEYEICIILIVVEAVVGIFLGFFRDEG